MSDVASSQNLSPTYLASFFQKYTGKTFLVFYNEVRLMHAVNDMLISDDSLENIALNNGFSDVRSFTALFKKKYSQLPSAYRKKYISGSTSTIFEEDINKERTSRENVEKIASYPSIIKYQSYYRQDATPASLLVDTSKAIDAGELRFSAETVPLTHNFHKVMCIGSAKQFHPV